MELNYKLEEYSKQPIRATKGSSGYDLFANLYIGDGKERSMVYDNTRLLRLNPGDSILIDTGLSIELDWEHYEAQVRPRSGKSNKCIYVSLGTIDSDYRGSIKVFMHNQGEYPFDIKHGDSIAQLVFQRVEHPRWHRVSKLNDTDRGDKGFGHSDNETLDR